MRVIVHLSDLHFGRVDDRLLPPLASMVAAARPDLVVISGDLTQRARTHEFAAAKAFLDTLPRPQIIVPGNHDVPLHNVVSRWLTPLVRFRHYIESDLEPFFADAEIAVAGINTARSLTFKNGRINEGQIARLAARLDTVGPEVTRIVVTHHPFDLPGEASARDLVGRARMAMEGFARSKVDLVLSGHFHFGHTGHSAVRYRIPGHSALLLQAGTATSTRVRTEVNSCNVIRVARPEMGIERWDWDAGAGAFRCVAEEGFRLGPEGWAAVDRHEAPHATRDTPTRAR